MSWVVYLAGLLAICIAVFVAILTGALHFFSHGLVLAFTPFLPGITTMDSDLKDPLSSWKGPRKVTLQRRSNGFGFTLRHFIVYPPESAIAELNRLQETGGDGPKHKNRISALEPMDTIFVKQVKAEGPAHQAGLSNGDRIVSVNGESVTGKTYQQVVNLIQLCDTNLTLFVVPREEDILQVAYPASAYRAVSQQTKTADHKTSSAGDQGRKEAEIGVQNSGINISSVDDHDVMVVGKGVVSEETESMKERTVTDGIPSPSHRGGESGRKTEGNVSATTKSETYRNRVNERKHSESRQPYRVQRVTASTISHESAGPMKVTLVNPSSASGETSAHVQKDQRTFRLTNVLNSQSSSKTPSTNGGSSVPDDVIAKYDTGIEGQEMQQQRHVASLKSYYEAAKLANSSQTSSEKVDVSKSLNHGYSRSVSENADTSKSSNHGYSSSVDNLLSQSGFSPAQTVLNIQPQKSMNSSTSCDNLLTNCSRNGVGKVNRQVSIINGQSVARTEEQENGVSTWKNEQESVKVSKSNSGSTAKVSVRVNDTEINDPQEIQRDEYTSHATRVTVSASVSADNLSHSARSVRVGSAERINVSPKHEGRSRAVTIHDTGSRSTLSSSASAGALSGSQVLASGRVVHLSNQHQVLPDKPSDNLTYWDKKSITSSRESLTTDSRFTTSDGSFFSWRRTGSRRGSADSDVSGGRSIGSQGSGGKSKPPVPKRESSKVRVRERSMERDKQRERTMHERHRSRSYDRLHQRSNTDKTQGNRKLNSAVPEGILLDDGSIFLSGRNDSISSSNSAGSGAGGEKESRGLPGQSGRQRLVRRTSYLKATGSDGEEDDHGDSASVTSSQEGERPSREKITPKRNASIRKLKSFFGEGTPKIVEAQHMRRRSLAELLGSEPVAKEGPMNVKLSANRSWKPVWAILKGQFNKLFLMKEQRDPTQNPSLLDQPICVNGSSVDIAYDYTKKKKNVIRLTTAAGLHYLLQVSDTDTMLAWIKVIQENNVPDQSKDANLLQLLDKSGKGDGSTHPPKVPSPSSYRKKFFKTVSSPTPGKPRPTAKEEMLAKAKASQSFADRMKRHIRGRGRTGGYSHPLDDHMQGSATFGVALEQCTPTHSNEMVPQVVEICCSIVEAKGLDVVGIYRVPGNTAGISYLKEELRKGADEIDLTDERWQDVNVISSLLKLFFRKLPNPLVPMAQYKDFIAANRREEPSERMWALRRQIHNLPDHHYETFKYLANHLKVVAHNADVNRMEVRNLAIVFGPTLVRSGDDSMVTMVTDMSDQCKIVESLIQHCDWFFSDDVESQQDVPCDAIKGGGGGVSSAERKSAPSIASSKEEDEADGEEFVDMDRTGPLKTSSMEDLNMDVGMFNPKDLILSVNVAAQRKKGKGLSNSMKANKMDTREVKYRRPSPEPQLHTIKLADQELLKLNVGKTPITIDIGNEKSMDISGVRKGNSSGKVLMRRSSQSSVDSKSSAASDDSGSVTEMDNLLQGSLFGSSHRSYHPRSYYQNFQFGSTRGRKMSDSENNSQLNLEQELKSLTNATKRDSWVQSDYSKEKERIEREHEEALRDLEKEDNTNIEELFKSTDYLSELSAVSSKIMDYTKKGVESPSSNRRQMIEKAAVVDHSKSANNNNALAPKVSPKRDSLRKAAVGERGSRHESLHIDEIDLESDFVQSMKATFEERLQKVLYHESEDDSSRPTSLVEKDPTTLSDVPRSMHYRSSSADTGSIRRRLDSPKREPSSGSNSQSGSPVRSKESIKASRSKVGSSPSHSPKKCSRIEVILTMEKRETTPATLRDNIANNAQEVAKTRRSAKDTTSIKEKNREKRRRRHTVGGGKDFGDFAKAIKEHHLSKGDSQKLSAMDRLKPFGKENVKSTAKPQDIKSWLESERQRSTTSSPNLLSTVQSSIARIHPAETEKQKREKELRRKSTPILGATDFNEAHKLSRMPRYCEIESYL